MRLKGMTHTVEILEASPVTHNVRRLRVEKPDGYRFTPGQATLVGIDRDGWREERHPFTFTSLNEWDDLEFTIKIYPDHDGLTARIGELSAGDRLVLEDPWGTINYKGPGTFIAGGAGVTPFIAILRARNAEGGLAGHRLIFANKTERDIILREEFEAMPGLECVWVVTDDDGAPDHMRGFIDRDFLKRHVEDNAQNFYVCGPDDMVGDIKSILTEMGAEPDALTFEE
jgi:hypothetical protein